MIRGAVPRVLFVGASEVGAQLDDLLAADGRVVESLAPARVFLALSADPSPISALVFALPTAQVVAHLERLLPLPPLAAARVVVIGPSDPPLAGLLEPLAARALHLPAFAPEALAAFLAEAPAEVGPPSPASPLPGKLLVDADGRAPVELGPPSPASPLPEKLRVDADGRAPVEVGPPSLAPPLPANSLAVANGRAPVPVDPSSPASPLPANSRVDADGRAVVDSPVNIPASHPRGSEPAREFGGREAFDLARAVPISHRPSDAPREAEARSRPSLPPASFRADLEPSSLAAPRPVAGGEVSSRRPEAPPSAAPPSGPSSSDRSPVFSGPSAFPQPEDSRDSVRPSSHPVPEEAAPLLDGLGADVPLGAELRALLDAAEKRVRSMEFGSMPPRSPDGARSPDSRRGELPSGRPDLLVSQEALELLEGEGTFGGSRSLTGEASVAGTPGSLPRGTSHGKSSAPNLDPEGTAARGLRSTPSTGEHGASVPDPRSSGVSQPANLPRNERDAPVAIAHVRPPPLPTLDGAEAFLHRTDGTSTAPVEVGRSDTPEGLRGVFPTPDSDPRVSHGASKSAGDRERPGLLPSDSADLGTYSPPTALLRPSVSSMTTPASPAAPSATPELGPRAQDAVGIATDGPPLRAAAPSADAWSIPQQPVGPFALVRALGAAIAARADGILTVTGETGERRVRLEGGDILSVSSSCPEDALPLFLATEGRLRRDVAQRLAARPAKHPRLVAAALVAEGWLAQDDLWSVLAAHAEAILVRLLRSENGLFAAGVAKDGGAVALDDESPFGGRPGAAVFVEAARRALDREATLSHFGGVDARLGAVVGLPLLRECGLAESEERRLADPATTLAELAGDDEHDVLACILATLGIFRFVIPLTPEGGNRPEHYAFQADAQAFEARLAIRLALVEEGDYFAILGVPRAANGYEIRGAYLRLRKDFATHRLDALGLATRRRDVEQVLFVLDEAYEVLRDETKRERYRRAIG